MPHENSPTTTPAALPVKADRLAFNAKETCALLGGISLVTLWRMERANLLHRVPGIPGRLYAKAELERLIRGELVKAA